jgi:hypothetical protein
VAQVEAISERRIGEVVNSEVVSALGEVASASVS